MGDIEYFFTVLLGIQFFHSIEELSNNFHEKFPLFKMKFSTFLTFEILFFGFWTTVLLLKNIPFRDQLMATFNIIMFANGLWHLVWWGIIKKYVPGLVTAPLFVVVFMIYYFKIVF